MGREPMATDFLPAERATAAELARDVAIMENGVPLAVLDAIPVNVLFLNDKRQIVYCNGAFKANTNAAGFDEVIGRRPGEALGCLHAASSKGGCGTTKFCRHCGAAMAILESLRGAPAMEECRMVRSGAVGDEALDLQVFAKRMTIQEEFFILFTALDISHEKRRDALERVFFHDVLNSASGLFMYSGLVENGDIPSMTEAGSVMHHASGRLLETVQTHKDMLAAERGRLSVCVKDTDPMSILQDVRDAMLDRQESRTRQLVVSAEAETCELVTDPGLVRRVLGALVLNALEAVEAGETVTLGSRRTEKGVEFSVHNPGVMPGRVYRQLFKRSFSTKGKGRGLGLYNAKLLVEGYLGGSLRFESSEDAGTTFTVRLLTASGRG